MSKSGQYQRQQMAVDEANSAIHKMDAGARLSYLVEALSNHIRYQMIATHWSQGCAEHDIIVDLRPIGERHSDNPAQQLATKRLAAISKILSGDSGVGNQLSLEATAQSFIDRCRMLTEQRDEVRTTLDAIQLLIRTRQKLDGK